MLINVLFLLFTACNSPDESYVIKTSEYKADTFFKELQDTVYADAGTGTFTVETGDVKPQELVSFAQTLTHIPYKYGSTDPKEGFDCSGFVTYVFNHFGIKVPRSSVDFTNSNQSVKLKDTKPGDLILFTGTDSTKRVVGHMGIIISKPNESITFIHSTSGKADGVTETPLNTYYQGRFVKAIRIFGQNNSN